MNVFAPRSRSVRFASLAQYTDPSGAPLGVPPHTLLLRGASRGNWQNCALEEVRDDLRAQTRSERREERLVALGDCRFSFDETGAAYVAWRSGARFGRRRLLTAHALAQLLRMLSPGRATLLENLILRGDVAGPKLAARVMRSLVRGRHHKHVIRFRVVRRSPSLWTAPLPARDDVAAAPIAPRRSLVIAALSTSYTPYDDLDFVSDLLDRLPKSMALRVISCWRSSDGLALRTSLQSGDHEDTTPMVEFRNSEIGTGAASMTASVFKLVCTNGMYGWGPGSVTRWSHRGAVERVGDELSDALQRAFGEAERSRDLYLAGATRRVGGGVDDATDWLDQQRSRYGLSQTLTRRIVDALSDETTSRQEDGSFTVASVVDAITLHAQQESFTGSYELGRLAGRLLEQQMV